MFTGESIQIQTRLPQWTFRFQGHGRNASGSAVGLAPTKPSGTRIIDEVAVKVVLVQRRQEEHKKLMRGGREKKWSNEDVSSNAQRNVGLLSPLMPPPWIVAPQPKLWPPPQGFYTKTWIILPRPDALSLNVVTVTYQDTKNHFSMKQFFWHTNHSSWQEGPKKAIFEENGRYESVSTGASFPTQKSK